MSRNGAPTFNKSDALLMCTMEFPPRWNFIVEMLSGRKLDMRFFLKHLVKSSEIKRVCSFAVTESINSNILINSNTRIYNIKHITQNDGKIICHLH